MAAFGFRAHVSDPQAPGFVRSPPALTELQGTFLDTTFCGYVGEVLMWEKYLGVTLSGVL